MGDKKQNMNANPEGMFRVEGTVFKGGIQSRHLNKTTKTGRPKKVNNVVDAIGYKIVNVHEEEKALKEKEKIREKITELKRNRNQVEDFGAEMEKLVREEEEVMRGTWKFMEKYEAVGLCFEYGVRNATIRPRNKPKKDEEGQVIRVRQTVNLHPVKEGRTFTDDDRLYPVFELDKNGKMKRNPANLVIEKEDCTEKLWEIIEEKYKKIKPKNKRPGPARMSDEEKAERVQEALSSLGATSSSVPDEWISEDK